MMKVNSEYVVLLWSIIVCTLTLDLEKERNKLTLFSLPPHFNDLLPQNQLVTRN